MKCLCCLSEKILTSPLFLEGYFCCKKCGLFFKLMDKKGSQNYNIKKHYQKIDPHESVAHSKQAFFDSALEYLSSKQKKKNILDVGCGYGYFLELAKQSGWHGYGVEIMKGAADIAAKKMGNNNIFSGRLKEARYPQNSFDAISLWDILFIVDDPFEELQECYRILRHGGTIGIRVRNAFFQQMVYHVYQPCSGVASRLSIKNPTVFHRYCYSSQSIRELLLRVGFRQIRIFNSPITTGDPYKHTSIKELTLLAKRIIDLAAKFIFWVSGNRWVVGPSLLIWAEKPIPNTKVW